MTLPATAPQWVVSLKDRFLESSTITGTLGLSAAGFYYPRVSSIGTLPAMVLERTSFQASRTSNGGVSTSGTCTAVLFLDGSPSASLDEGQIETAAETVAQDLTGLLTDGLFISGISVSRCSDPSPGMFAGGDTGQPERGNTVRTIMFTVEWGDA